MSTPPDLWILRDPETGRPAGDDRATTVILNAVPRTGLGRPPRPKRLRLRRASFTDFGVALDRFLENDHATRDAQLATARAAFTHTTAASHDHYLLIAEPFNRVHGRLWDGVRHNRLPGLAFAPGETPARDAYLDRLLDLTMCRIPFLPFPQARDLWDAVRAGGTHAIDATGMAARHRPGVSGYRGMYFTTRFGVHLVNFFREASAHPTWNHLNGFLDVLDAAEVWQRVGVYNAAAALDGHAPDLPHASARRLLEKNNAFWAGVRPEDYNPAGIAGPPADDDDPPADDDPEDYP